MKKFKVVIHYAGAYDCEVCAKTEEEAFEKAYMKFEEEDERNLVANLADVNVCDCWEV